MHPSKPYSVHLTQSADVFVVVVGMLGGFWGVFFVCFFVGGTGVAVLFVCCCCFQIPKGFAGNVCLENRLKR